MKKNVVLVIDFTNMNDKIKQIEDIASKSKWKIIMNKPENALILFGKDNILIDVWWTKMTVALYLEDEHTTKYMYNLSLDDLFELMMSPIGYKHEGEVKITKRYN